MFGRLLLLVVVLALAVSVVARSSRGGGHEQVYRVQAYDTLWSIASSHYSGDPRAAIWRIQKRNRMTDPGLVPGERIVLP